METNCTVGAYVKERPSRARVFEAFGIDYCCGGKRSLEEACAKKGVDVEAVRAALREADQAGTDEENAANLDCPALADHIEATHHAYLKMELPRLKAMTEKVARVHGEEEPRLHQVRDVFDHFQADLLLHMQKEERVLFPAIRQAFTGEALSPIAQVLAGPIGVMEAEHAEAGNALETLRTLTDGYEPPEWACNTYRALFDGLAQIERDMHRHVHKENEILFPRALEHIAALTAQAG
ncbi:MAG: iron-sulfur cluster repair di-iron protein [Candidatus Hydrogenedentes bacterium]|nr:iron-sulfur cluster repair di-iron protein [Candidatus Hydrogenedentota bacterium]